MKNSLLMKKWIWLILFLFMVAMATVLWINNSNTKKLPQKNEETRKELKIKDLPGIDSNLPKRNDSYQPPNNDSQPKKYENRPHVFIPPDYEGERYQPPTFPEPPGEEWESPPPNFPNPYDGMDPKYFPPPRLDDDFEEPPDFEPPNNFEIQPDFPPSDVFEPPSDDYGGGE